MATFKYFRLFISHCFLYHAYQIINIPLSIVPAGADLEGVGVGREPAKPSHEVRGIKVVSDSPLHLKGRCRQIVENIPQAEVGCCPVTIYSKKVQKMICQ